jgi:predicted phosphodiesterase
MKILIYSDVHGNLPAFEKMVNVESDVSGYISLGDIVNYGPWSNECVDFAMSLPNSTFLMGNHEEAFLDRNYPGSNELVELFFKTCSVDFARFDEISQFLSDCRIGNFHCIHTIDGDYIYPDTQIELDGNYFIGHSHCQFKYVNNSFELYNTGSVGQNRTHINEINYLVYNLDTFSVEMKSCLYDIELLLSKMKSLNYPDQCINYYKNKKIKIG